MLDDVDQESKTESLEERLNKDVRHEELLNLRNSQRDEEIFKRDITLGRREKNLLHDLFASKHYLINLKKITTHVDQARHVVNDKSISQTFEEVDDSSILNFAQRKMFDRVLEHYLFQHESQLLLHVNDGARTGKSLCVEIIFKHLHYHVARYNKSILVIRAALTGVAAHKIDEVILHLLLSLSMHESFTKLGADRLIRLQQSFRDCKLLIIDEKSMLRLRFLYKIDFRLRAILAELEQHFGGMNILLCEDFAQLSPVDDISLYSRPNHTSLELQIVMTAYLVFNESIFLTQLI